MEENDLMIRNSKLSELNKLFKLNLENIFFTVHTGTQEHTNR